MTELHLSSSSCNQIVCRASASCFHELKRLAGHSITLRWMQTSGPMFNLKLRLLAAIDNASWPSCTRQLPIKHLSDIHCRGLASQPQATHEEPWLTERWCVFSVPREAERQTCFGLAKRLFNFDSAAGILVQEPQFGINQQIQAAFETRTLKTLVYQRAL